LVIVWASIIFWLSSSPDGQGGFWLIRAIPYGDKLAHAAAFGLLAILLLMALRKGWIAIITTSLYGLSDEVHQYFVPGRSVDVTDWVADTLGAILAVTLVSFLTRGRRGKSL
jgi:VanZ family protein